MVHHKILYFKIHKEDLDLSKEKWIEIFSDFDSEEFKLLEILLAVLRLQLPSKTTAIDISSWNDRFY